MSEVYEVESLALEEVAESFIERMQAPPGDGIEEVFAPRPNNIRDVLLVLGIGLLLGVLGYKLLKTPGTTEELVATTPAEAVEPPKEIRAPVSAVAVAQETVEEPTQAVPARTSEVMRHGSFSLGKFVTKGWHRYRQARYREASVAFGRAVHWAPKKTKGYYGLAISLFEQGFDEAALGVIESGLRKHGGKAKLMLLAGTIYQWLGNEKKAREMYRGYLKANPRSKFAKDVKRLLSLRHLPSPFGK